MSEAKSSNLGLPGMALLLGVLGDALFRATPWGLGVPLWMGLAFAGGWSLMPARPEGGSAASRWPPILVFFFATCLMWRDSPFLGFWDVVAMLAALSLWAMQWSGVRLRLGGFLHYAAGAIATGVNAALGALLPPPPDAPARPSRRSGPRIASALIGSLIAVPLLMVFGGLLMSADPGFDNLVRSALRIDLSLWGSHILLAGFVAWIYAGFLRPIITGSNPVLATGMRLVGQAKPPQSFGTIEIGIPLGVLALMFTVFVGLQARYLVGGESVILATTGLTYAEYARTGFFELVAAAALLLPVLLVADWSSNRDDRRQIRVFRTLAALLLALIGLIMLGALQRMRLYVDAYGLTGDRFYATAFMGWIAVLLGYFGATVLRGLRDRFALGTFMTGFGLLAVLNVVNPDAWVARVNLARADAGKELDTAYITSLSADAVPVIAARLAGLREDVRCTLSAAIDEHRTSQDSDWRSWNLSRSRASRAVDRNNAQCSETEPAN